MVNSDNSVLTEFPSVNYRARDALVFWCRNCNLLRDDQFVSRCNLFDSKFMVYRAEIPTCEDLSWSSYCSPSQGMPASSYLSHDNSASVFEFSAKRKKCMVPLRE